MLALCGTTDKAEAQKIKDELTAEKLTIKDAKTKQRMDAEINDMQTIINLPNDKNKPRQEMGSDINNI